MSFQHMTYAQAHCQHNSVSFTPHSVDLAHQGRAEWLGLLRSLGRVGGMPKARQAVIDQVDRSRMLQADPRDPRSLGHGPCKLTHKPEDKYRSNAYCMWSSCRACALCLVKFPFKDAPASTWSGPIPANVELALQKAKEAGVWEEMTGHMMRGFIKEVEAQHQKNKGRKAKKSDGVVEFPLSGGPVVSGQDEEEELDQEEREGEEEASTEYVDVEAERLQEEIATLSGAERLQEEIATSSGGVVIEDRPGGHDSVSSGGHRQEEHKQEGETEKHQKHVVTLSITASDSTVSVAF